MNNPLNNSLIRFMAGVYVVCAVSHYGCGEKGKLSQKKKDIEITIDAIVGHSSEQHLFEKKYEETGDGYDFWIRETNISGEEIKFKYVSGTTQNIKIEIKKDGCEFEIKGGLNSPAWGVYVWNEKRVPLYVWRNEKEIERAVGKEYLSQFSDAELETMFFTPAQKKLTECIDRYRTHINEADTVFKEKRDAESKGFRKAVDLLKNF